MSVVLLVIVAATASWFAWTQVLTHRRRLDIPHLEFTGDIPQPRYIRETKAIMDKGYTEASTLLPLCFIPSSNQAISILKTGCHSPYVTHPTPRIPS